MVTLTAERDWLNWNRTRLMQNPEWHTDMLVINMPVPEEIGGVSRKLHLPHSVIGTIAAQTGSGKLVQSHFMARSLENLEENLQEV